MTVFMTEFMMVFMRVSITVLMMVFMMVFMTVIMTVIMTVFMTGFMIEFMTVVAIFNHPGRAHYAGLLLQWPLAVAVVVSRESRDEKSFLVGFCPLENKDVK